MKEMTNFVKVVGSNEYNFMIWGDPHIDSEYCDIKLFKKHLNYALENNIDMYCIGDLLDVMQGRNDPRRKNKQDKDHYFNWVIDYTVELLEPYKHLIKFIGYGNHETSVSKNNDIDLLQIIVNRLNDKGGNIELGSYSGWWQFKLNHTTSVYNYKVKYIHGFGGGGNRTKGVIQYTDVLVSCGDVDLIVMGHTHDKTEVTFEIEYLNQQGNIKYKSIECSRVPSYKNESIKGMGWHVERGAPPKPRGSKLYTIKYDKVLGIDYQVKSLGEIL